MTGRIDGTANRLDSSNTVSRQNIEAETQERGQHLLAGLRAQEGNGGAAEWFYGQVMAIATKDEATKVEMFRFVDALPALKTPDSVMRHLDEYLLRDGIQLPHGADNLLRLLDKTEPTRRFTAWASHFGAGKMARRFIAGANAREATSAVERLRRQKMTFTLDLLGEAVASEAEAVAYQNKYLELIADLAVIAKKWSPNPQIDRAPWGDLPTVNVSVKLSSLYARFDPMAADATCAAVKARLRPILRSAKERGVFVNFDREQHDYCAIAGRIFEEILCEDEFRDWQDVGIVIQAYLRRSDDDLRRLRDWTVNERGTPITVRLVKGAYWDYESIVSAQRGHELPVWSKKAETDACFERLTEFLIDNWQILRPAIATHNVRSAAHAQTLAIDRQLPPNAVEYQVLFGMGEPIGRALARQGERVRVYVPFGELLPGMAYLVRRLLENSSNDSFIRSSSSSDVRKLLAAPQTLLKNGHSANGQPVDGHSFNGHQNGKSVTAVLPKSAFHNEPETDFALSEMQQKMQTALANVHKQLGGEVPIVIGNEKQSGISVYERTDPSLSSRVVARVQMADANQAQTAIDMAIRAFPIWRDTPVRDRAVLLHRTADILNERRFEIAAWQTFEVGKPWREADADVAEAIDFCRFYADEMLRLSQPRKRNLPGEWNEYIYEARGVCAVIAPWNFPLAILTGMATAALASGNTVVLKPAEQSSRSGYFLFEALTDAGIPIGVVNFLPGDGEIVGKVLVNSPDVATIAFTGSKTVGLEILRKASVVHDGQHEIKRVIAEMGGKNAIIVDEDADLDEAVLGVLHSTVGFAGQKCSACSRVIVIGSAYEPFCARLSEAVKSIRIGAADDPATTLGPVVDTDSVARVQCYIEIGKAEGKLLAIQEVPESLVGTGNYVPATVFVDCPANGRLCQEEIFGPVLAVLKADSLAAALQIAQGTPYALTGGFYSRSPRNIEAVRREYRVGNLYINRKITGALVDRHPFGGARMSGVGAKAGGPDYLLHFLTARTITESVMRRGFAPSGDDSSVGEGL